MATTTDRDDVRIAQAWLRRPQAWHDAAVVRDYEQAFAAWNGSARAFAFMGGRVGLSAIIHALALRPGDEVLVPAYTCVVVANAFNYAGVSIRWCDIELDTYGLSAESVKANTGPATRAVLVQHLFGIPSRDLLDVIALARAAGLHVIEDCAHSAGAELAGVKVGNFGDAAFYSSEHSKAFSTVQGGVAVSSDPVLIAGIEEYCAQAPLPSSARTNALLHGVMADYYRFKDPLRWLRGDRKARRYRKYWAPSTSPGELQGIRPSWYGERMPAPLAALGSNQLAKLDSYNQRRAEGALVWQEWADRAGHRRPVPPPQARTTCLRYPVLVEAGMKRDVSWGLRTLGVKPGVWFRGSLHPNEGVMDGCPAAAEAAECSINLPTLLSRRHLQGLRRHAS